MTETAEQAELSRRVALACGRKLCAIGGGILTAETVPPDFDWDKHGEWSMWVPNPAYLASSDQYGTSGWWRPIDFATSLDACFGPGGPVEYAKAQGWEILLSWWEGASKWEAAFYPAPAEVQDLNPATALCRAFLAAVESTEAVA